MVLTRIASHSHSRVCNGFTKCYSRTPFNLFTTMTTITPMKAWMMAATPQEQEALAEMAGTSRAMLYQYAGGFREASAQRGGDLERVTKAMAKASKGRLPVVYRTDVVDACRQCEYAQKCLGERAVASHFPIVDPRQGELFVESEGGHAD